MQFAAIRQTRCANELRDRAIIRHLQPARITEQHSGAKRAVAAFFSLVAACLLLLPTSALAQEFRATVSGTVTDPSGAVVPGANVQVQETSTGAISRTTSDAAGEYVVPFLLPGNYSITVKASGFEVLKRGGILLQAQEHPIINLVLTIGSATQTVTVTSAAPRRSSIQLTRL